MAIPVRTMQRLTGALDASVDITVRWQGEELDRLFDAAHADLVQRCVTLLSSFGWQTRVEVSFNHFGDRGRVDLLAFHRSTRALLVVEAKSAIADTQETLGRLDVKARLGPILAAGVGWDAPARVVPALAVADSRRARRVIADHEGLFARFTVHGRKALAWLRRPASPAPTGVLWFMNVTDSRGAGVTRHGRVRRVAGSR